MSDLKQGLSPVVAALMASQPRRMRGRPSKEHMQDNDTIRAALVVWAFTEHPGRFKTRRQAIIYLQQLCRVARTMAERIKKLELSPEWSESLERAALTFPLYELEQSVSRGMIKHNGILGKLEKLAKKSL
jgi:hypothetical protein